MKKPNIKWKDYVIVVEQPVIRKYKGCRRKMKYVKYTLVDKKTFNEVKKLLKKLKKEK